MDFSLFCSIFDSYNFGREEIFIIRMVATANNRRTVNIIYSHYLQNNIQKQNKLNVFRKIDCPSLEDDRSHRRVN